MACPASTAGRAGCVNTVVKATGIAIITAGTIATIGAPDFS
jgi:hypothetical protein